MIRRKWTAIAFAIGTACAASSAAWADSATDYNLFVFNSLNVQGSDTQGRVAVGGNAVLDGYTVGASVGAGDNLVVGGNFTQQNWGSVNGSIVVGGASSIAQDYFRSQVLPAGTASPVNFASEITRLKNISTTLAGYVANGTVTDVYDSGGSHGLQLSLTGTSSTLNVFTIDASDLARVNTFNLNVASGSEVLINVLGTVGSMSNFSMNGVDPTKTLWNFANATSLTFSGIAVEGSVLATNADWVQSGWGQINGQVFINSYSGSNAGGSVQVNDVRYAGSLLSLDPSSPSHDGPGPDAVPEPGTWAMLVFGFGLIGAAIRFRRPARRIVG